MSPTIVAPDHEIDIATIDSFRQEIADAAAAGGDLVVVDLTEVEFIDSSGIGAVIEAHARLKRADRALVVVAPRGSAAAVVFTLSGLRNQLTIYETRGAALASG